MAVNPWELYESTEPASTGAEPWTEYGGPSTDFSPVEQRELAPPQGYERVADGGYSDYRPAGESELDAWARRRAENRPDFVNALAQGATLGFADEADAALQALGTGRRNLMGQIGLGEGTDYSMGETYDAVARANRAAMQGTREQYPVSSFAAEVIGGIPTGGALFRGIQGAVGSGARGLAGVAQRAAPAVTEGAVTGYGYSEGDVGDRLQGAALGGALGGVSDIALRGVMRGRTPEQLERDAAKRGLQDRGIDLTYGQLAGGGAQRVEDALSTIPFLGDPIAAARGRATRDLNTAAINDALQPIGQSVPQGTSGRGAIDDMMVRVGGAIDSSVANATFAPDQQFSQSLAGLSRQLVGLPSDTQAQLRAIVDSDIIGPIANAGGALTGRDLSQMFSRLSGLRRTLGSSSDTSQQEVGRVIGQLQDSILDTIERQGTGDVQAIRDARKAYARAIRPERASSGLGAEGGVFTAAQLQNAVRASEGGVRNQRFARGNAMMQDLSDSAVGIMGKGMPSSGTTERAAVTYGLLGGGSLLNPIVIKAAAAKLAMDAAYSAPTLKVINAISKSKTKETLDRNINFAKKAASSNPELRDALSRMIGAASAQDGEER